MKCKITTLFDKRSGCPYQALIEVEGARPFENLTGKVLARANEKRGGTKILIGAKTPEDLTRLIGEKRIALTALARASGLELEIVTAKQEQGTDLQDQRSNKAGDLAGRSILWAQRELDKQFILAGGLIDCHRHLDRQDTLNEAGYRLIANGATLEEKWDLIEKLKRSPRYLETLHDRVRIAVEDMISQGIVACRTYIDVDSTVGLEAIKAALEIKREYENVFILQIAASPVKGLDAREDREWFEKGCELVDLVGGLPSRGRRGVTDSETTLLNMRLLFEIARSCGKDLDMQIDQANDPDERETNILARLALQEREKGFTGRIAATHAISLSAYSDLVMRETIEKLVKAKVDVIVCPGAALSMKQNRGKLAPIHNSIAPVLELMAAGVTVGIGTDNVSDIYMPFTTGDMREEIREMARAIRFQGDLDTLAKIATTNGKKILGVSF